MTPKSCLKIIVILFIVANSSLSWGGVDKIGIWCELDSSLAKSDGKGFFFFDEIKVGFFEVENRGNQINSVLYRDLSIYETSLNKLNWQSLEYDNHSKRFTNHSFEFDTKTLELSHRMAPSKVNEKFNCDVYSEWKTFLYFLKNKKQSE